MCISGFLLNMTVQVNLLNEGPFSAIRLQMTIEMRRLIWVYSYYCSIKCSPLHWYCEEEVGKLVHVVDAHAVLIDVHTCGNWTVRQRRY